jgi:hypothetical protein
MIFWRIFPLCLLVLLGANAVRANDFVPGLDDIPLAPGLVAADEPDLVFDKPEGRLVETSATSRQSEKKLRDFYAVTLPQMGWQAEKSTKDAAKDTDRYRRDQEVLTLVTHRKDGNTDIIFRLNPQGAKYD